MYVENMQINKKEAGNGRLFKNKLKFKNDAKKFAFLNWTNSRFRKFSIAIFLKSELCFFNLALEIGFKVRSVTFRTSDLQEPQILLKLIQTFVIEPHFCCVWGLFSGQTFCADQKFESDVFLLYGVARIFVVPAPANVHDWQAALIGCFKSCDYLVLTNHNALFRHR